MAVGITTTTYIDQMVNTINAEVIHTLQQEGVFPGVVERVSVPKGARSYTEPKISTVAAVDLTEGLD